ncbi:MAG: vWA domain-containing protein [Acidimicrobiales bacterium]
MDDRSVERFVVAFAATLRRAGLDVPPGSVIMFARGLGAVGLGDEQLVYWTGQATLVRRREDKERYDSAFAAFFGHGSPAAMKVERRRVAPEPDTGADDDDENAARHSGDQEHADGAPVLRYSAIEVLRRQDFARYEEDDWAVARRLIAELRAGVETRRARRLRPSSKGSSLDLPRTVRWALGSDGEPVRRAFRMASPRPRRLVFILDISGSMEPYVRAFMRFTHASVVSRPAGGVEVFVLGTRVTRITRQLSSRDPDAALAASSRAVEDWYGGTRLGGGLRYFNDQWGSKGTARGAVVVIFSDGWDRGDPGELASEMKRLSRLAHRVVWVNPLRGSPGYEPLARGMAAALPFVDEFVDGHSIASLEDLASVVSGPRR